MGAKDTPIVRQESVAGLELLAGRFLALIVISTCLLGLATTVTAQDFGSDQIELTARAGYDGYYKGDFWVPVRVNVANSGPDIQGHLQIAAGSRGSDDRVLYRSPVTLPTSSNKGQTLYVYAPSLVSTLTVELLDESDRVIATTETNKLNSLSSDSMLYAVITREPGRFEYLENVSGGRSEAAVAYLSLEELPEVGAALNAVDVMVFHGEDSGRLTAAQHDALAGWLDTGGQLVVTGGPAWQEASAGLADLLPVDISGTVTLGDLPSLREQGKVSFRDPGPYVVTESQLRTGELLIHEDGLPLLARRGHGRGSAFFLAADPTLAPLLDWQGREAVWSEVIHFAKPLPEWANGARNSFTASNAVSSLPASDLPSPWALFVFLLAYVIVVGPLNYLVLRRMGRRELAWLTIPSLVLLFSVGAYIVGFQLKGNETIINQMSIVYGQVEGEQVRVQTLIGLYSPRRASYDLVMPSEAIPRPFDRTLSTLAGQGNIEAIERGESVVVSDLRVDVGGVETLVADSYQPAPEVIGSVRLRPGSGNDVYLDVRIQNNSSNTLENSTLLVGSSALPLGDLAPGGTVDQSELLTSPAGIVGGTGSIGGYVAPPPTTSPLQANAQAILGSTQFYNDREVYPRWQLLQAMAPDYTVSPASYAPGSYTLIAWSDQPQLDLNLREGDYASLATSLFFLELPVSQELSDQAQLTVPKDLLSWAVLAADGVYDARVDDLLLRTGSVEFEFTPWPDFQSLQVQDLAIVIQPPAGLSSQRTPLLRLWDWTTGSGSWQTPDNLYWGRNAIEDQWRYLGPGNAVRVQLSNPGPEPINILTVYPEFTGTVE